MGVSAGFHDAGVSVVDSSGNILFAGHSERYSKVKNDATLNEGIMNEALSYGMPNVRSGVRGNLYVKVKVDIPRNLTEEQMKKVREIKDGV